MNFIIDPSLVLYLPLYELDGSSFTSRDACGHLCTITGALWRPDGRSFDGNDDEIDCGNVLDTVPAGLSYGAWIKPTDKGAAGHGWLEKYNIVNQDRIFAYYDENNDKFVAAWEENDNGVVTLSSSTGKSPDTWYFVFFTWSVSDGTVLYVDGEIEDSDATATTLMRDGTARNLLLGMSPNGRLKGLIGEAWVYHRALAQMEIQYNYLATKWRYQ